MTPDTTLPRVADAEAQSTSVWGELIRSVQPRFAVRVDGREYPLTVPVVFGRAPSAPRIRQDRMPRLVPLPSPGGHLSSTHCEVRQEGAVVVVTDLRSTNGCTVILPGAVPRRLRQRESMVVTEGSRIDLAGEAVVDVVRRTPDEAGEAR